MKKQLILCLAILSLLTMPLFAMQHNSHDMKDSSMDHSTMDHGSMDHGSMDHDGMSASGDMVMLGTQKVEGIEAMAHIKDVKAAMAKMNMSITHHFMLMIKDQHGKTNDKGTVAVKIKGPDGSVSKPIKLMGMGGHFGADVTLEKPGMYTFSVGSKLADGVKRSFEFTYHVH